MIDDNSIDEFLARPYRDRQLIVLADSKGSIEESPPIRLSDYFRASPFEALTKEYWTKKVPSKEYWTNPKNWGLWGYVYDKSKGTQPAPKSGLRRPPNRVSLKEHAARLRFPPGHPLYDTVYAGHPLQPGLYLPIANFHRFLFEEKFNELLAVLWNLGAFEVGITFIQGKSRSTGVSVDSSIPVEIPVSVGASVSTRRSSETGANLVATFSPKAKPELPKNTVWMEYEPTWKNLATSRLEGQLKTMEVELVYDDDYGIDGSVAVGLQGFGLKLGGEFSRKETTRWKFHVTFASTSAV